MATEAPYAVTAPVIRIKGKVLGQLARDHLELAVEETTDGLRTLRLTLFGIGPEGGDPVSGPHYLDGTLDFGQRIEVILGPEPDHRIVFQGRISALEAVFAGAEPPTVDVFAEDALMDLRMTRRIRSYRDSSAEDIARSIAGFHGLRSEVAAPGPTYDVVQQWNMSDLAFLREVARRVAAEVAVEDDLLRFQDRGHRPGTSVTLVQGNHLLSLRVRADLAHQRTIVRVNGFDAQAREGIAEEAGPDVVQAEVTGGRVGPAVVKDALGERVLELAHDVPLTTGEARAWARGEMLRRARGFVAVHGVTRGTPDMVVGTRLTLERVGAPFEGGGYYVTGVRHTYDFHRGLRTTFDAERATVGGG